MRWTRQRRRAGLMAGRTARPVSDRAARERTALSASPTASVDVHMPPRYPGEDGWLRTAKSRWGPVAGVKPVDARESQPGLAVRLNPQTTVTKTNSSPGRSRSKPLKPSCRECRLIPEYLWRLPCAYYLCTRAAGALDTRHSLRLLLKVACALFIPGRNVLAKLGQMMPRECGSVAGAASEAHPSRRRFTPPQDEVFLSARTTLTMTSAPLRASRTMAA